ncbi:hypothetical protein MAR_023273 [Mya arenaria]|uniref:Uncharacterized protein n=1 Tax=Mya arenaria TaxID=6604 RepID=A0ABY7DVC7_MYAAR|nr:hypothetical protein MAR_023273 [Mya arenaria]
MVPRGRSIGRTICTNATCVRTSNYVNVHEQCNKLRPLHDVWVKVQSRPQGVACPSDIDFKEQEKIESHYYVPHTFWFTVAVYKERELCVARLVPLMMWAARPVPIELCVERTVSIQLCVVIPVPSTRCVFHSAGSFITDIPIIAIKSFAKSVFLAALLPKQHKYTINLNQELVAYGARVLVKKLCAGGKTETLRH